MALDAADIDQLRALLAQRARRLVRLRVRLREYRLQFLHLGIPLPKGEGEDLVTQSAAEEEEDGYVDGDGGYYPELRCNDGEYYYEDGQEEEDAVALDLERRICRLEHDHKTRLLEPPLEEEQEEGTHLYTDEALPNLSGRERGEGERKGRRWEQLRRQRRLHGRREVGRGVAASESSVYRGTSDTAKKTDTVEPVN
ncbi:unnamed protein product [Miscanthus lutarioriparius]|uniref:Uncharacterized protein n=1 Tax=Miscanthus lutarioriparius TaxID=422564 RepID=A0A811MHG1_9POAL|nr:unnamed protein product [Miscanthus lutarioriparius]